jgi:tetratricopeptide (TPR) repeat protein
MKIHNILLGVIFLFTATVAMATEAYKEAWGKGLKEYRTGKYKDAIVTLSEAAKLAETSNQKYLSICYKGYSLNKLKKFDDAVKVFQELMKVEGLSVKEKYNAFNQYVHNIYFNKKYEEVAAITEKTLADEKATTAMKTACAYLSCLIGNNTKKYVKMEKWAKKLCELNPKGSWNYRGVIFQAKALRSQKKYKEAEKLLNKEIVAKMDPYRKGEAHLERGHLKGAIGKHGEAIVEFTVVYEIPNGHPSHKEQAIVYLIERFNSAGKLEEADVWIVKIDTIKNKYWKTRAMFRQAVILTKQGKLKEAKTKFEECKEMGPWYKKYSDKEIAKVDKKLEAK